MIGSTNKGDLGEAMAIVAFLKRGYSVSSPLSSDSRYDLVVDKSDIFYRVQCKYTTAKNGVIKVVTSSTSEKGKHRSYTPEEIDLLTVYDTFSENVYFIPVLLIDNKNILHLRLTNPKNNQKIGIKMAKDFLDW